MNLPQSKPNARICCGELAIKLVLLRSAFLAAAFACGAAATAQESKARSARRLQIDFGSGGGLATQGWNNVTDPARSGLVLNSAVDASGKSTSVAVRQVDGWAGFNTNGFAAKGPYPPSAMRDSFYVQAGIDRAAKMVIEGLTPGQAYRFTVFASRMGDKARRTGRYVIGDRHVHLDAGNNTDKSATIDNVKPDQRGVVTLVVECPEGEDYAYLGALEIEGAFGEAREYKLPADSLDGPPIVTAKAWAIGDGKTGRLLWGENESASRHMASTTKIMTAWIVLELAAEKPRRLEEIVVMSERADRTGGTTAGIRAGERISVADLLFGLLLPSGNDAAVALGEHFGNWLPSESSDEGEKDSLARFTAEMNRRAHELGMKETHYFDPHGNSRNRSSARDLLKLGWHAMQNKAFRGYVNTRQHECIVAAADGSKRTIKWTNSNRLLDISGFDGIKTGRTGGAGNCLVSSGHRGKDHLLVVVLGSASQDGRFVDSRNLYRWAWRQRNHKP